MMIETRLWACQLLYSVSCHSFWLATQYNRLTEPMGYCLSLTHLIISAMSDKVIDTLGDSSRANKVKDRLKEFFV